MVDLSIVYHFGYPLPNTQPIHVECGEARANHPNHPNHPPVVAWRSPTPNPRRQEKEKKLAASSEASQIFAHRKPG